MNAKDQDFLLELLHTPSPTGFETEGQRCWLKHLKKHSDGIENDAYGTAWATIQGKNPDAPTIMLEAHADEIGYIIKHITKEGYLRLDRIGGSDAATARGRMLDIFGDKGTVPGIIGNTAIHLRKGISDEKAPKIHELYVDVGCKNEKEVAKLGLRVGHPAVYQQGAQIFNKTRVVGRALDNRIGGFIIAKVMQKLKASKTGPICTVHAVNAVQEEIGGYGAKMVTHRLHPDLALVLDVTHATDTPGIDHSIHGEVTLEGGPSLTHGTCNHPLVVERLIQVAKRKRIPIQHESSSRYSGTDTDSIYHVREGIPSALVSLPLRYMHSVVEYASLKDVEHTISILSEFILSLKAKDLFHQKLT